MFEKSRSIVNTVKILFINTLIKKGLKNEGRKLSLDDMNTETVYPMRETAIITKTNSTLSKTIPLLLKIFVLGKGIRLL